MYDDLVVALTTSDNYKLKFLVRLLAELVNVRLVSPNSLLTLYDKLLSDGMAGYQ